MKNYSLLSSLLACIALITMTIPAFASITTNYEYDDQYRLRYVSRSDGSTIEYQYDDAGNRTRKIVTYAPPADTTAPVIDTFSVPASASSLTVTGIVLSAGDAVGVTGYLLTETPDMPDAGAAGWSGTTAPVSYTFASAGDKTLYAWAKDVAGNVSAGVSEHVTITLPDTINPVITTFRVPATASTLSVPVVRLIASDNTGVAGYCLSESNNHAACSWNPSAPASFTFATEGTNRVYAWVKDAAGNISQSASGQVVVTIPKETLTVIIQGTGGGTVHSSPGQDINCSSGTCTVQLPKGSDQILLTMKPDDTSLFAGWNGSSNLNDMYPVYMTSSQQVTATFNTVSPAGAVTGNLFTMQNSVRVAAANVTVKLYQTDYVGYGYVNHLMRTAVSDANGNYTLPNLPSQSNYTLCFWPTTDSNLYPICYKDIDYYSGYTKTTVTVSAPNSTQLSDQEIKSGGVVSGRVTASDTLLGLSGVTVTAYRYFSNYSNTKIYNSITATTDSQGNYQLNNIPYGNYTISFSPPNSSNYLKSSLSSAPAINGILAVTTSTPIQGVNTTLSVGGSISGRIVDATTGNGISNISVKAVEATANSVSGTYKETVTDAQGNYRIVGLATKTYKVGADAQDIYYYPQYYPNTTDIWAAQLVPVTTGQETAQIDLSLTPGGKIAGYVSAAGNSNQISGITVKIHDPSGNLRTTATTDSFGMFKSPLLLPGEYKVCFESLNIINQCYSGKADATSADPVTLTAVNTSYIDASLTQRGSISGKIYNNTGGGLNGVAVNLYDATGSQLLKTTTSSGVGQIECGYGACGSYSFGGLAPGTYKLYFDANTTGYASYWYNLKSAASAADPVMVTLGVTTAADISLPVAVPVNALCGAAQGTTPAAKPVEGLCAPGTPSQVTANGVQWEWTCGGSYGGSSVNCTANRLVALMSVSLDGSGIGSVNSTPAGIACVSGSSNGCMANFDAGEHVTLISLGSNSSFSGWSGACTNSFGNCSVVMDVPKSVTATFTADPARVKVDGNTTLYYSIDAVMDALSSGGKIVRARNQVFTEDVVMISPYDVKLKGGYTSDAFTTFDPVNSTVIDGSLKIRNGTLKVERIKVR